MPMIDVYAPRDLLPTGSDRRIGEELTRAVLRAEGVSAPSPFHLENTAAFIHRMDPAAVQTAAEALPRTIRVQIITPPERTWVLLTEAVEGGWGIAGTAVGREEFAALAAKKT